MTRFRKEERKEGRKEGRTPGGGKEEKEKAASSIPISRVSAAGLDWHGGRMVGRSVGRSRPVMGRQAKRQSGERERERGRE